MLEELDLTGDDKRLPAERFPVTLEFPTSERPDVRLLATLLFDGAEILPYPPFE